MNYLATYSISTDERTILEWSFADKNSSEYAISDWEFAFTYLSKNGLSAMFQSLAPELMLSAPPVIQTKFKQDYFSQMARNNHFAKVYNEIVVFLSQHKIEVMPLKGIYLSQTIYSDIAWRSMSDIDILVKPNLVKDAYELLCRLANVSIDLDEFNSSDHHFPLFVYKGVSIEVHQALFPLNVKYNLPIQAIWERSNYQRDNNLVYNMDKVLLFIYLSLHIYYTANRGGVRLAWFYDLILLVNSADEAFFKNVSNEIEKHHLKKPLAEVFGVLSAISGLKFNYLEVSTSKKIIKRYIGFFSKSSSQKLEYSYSIAWERISQTNGIISKLQLGWFYIFKIPPQPNAFMYSWKLISRISHLFWSTLRMIGLKILQRTGIN